MQPRRRAIAVMAFGIPNFVRNRRNSSPIADRLCNNDCAAIRNA
jgi:hypothetical protein